MHQKAKEKTKAEVNWNLQVGWLLLSAKYVPSSYVSATLTTDIVLTNWHKFIWIIFCICSYRSYLLDSFKSWWSMSDSNFSRSCSQRLDETGRGFLLCIKFYSTRQIKLTFIRLIHNKINGLTRTWNKVSLTRSWDHYSTNSQRSTCMYNKK